MIYKHFGPRLSVKCITFFKRNLRGKVNTTINEPISVVDSELKQRPPEKNTLFRTSPKTETGGNANHAIVPHPYFKKTRIFEAVTEENKYIKLKQTITPLYKVSYEQQRHIKYKNCQSILRGIYKELKHNRIHVPSDKTGLPCPVEFTLASPVAENYRNKDEFSVRFGVDQVTRTVGFFVPIENGKFVCVEPGELNNLRKEHVQVATFFQQYIADSHLTVCTSFKKGHWRRLIVRSNSEGEIMAIIIMHPQALTEAELEAEKSKLRDFFTTGPGKVCNISSLYFQACKHSRCTNEQATYQLLVGKDQLIETVGDLKLRLSPETFIQINTEAAKVLYDVISAYSAVKTDTTLLDICCGAGAISLSLAKYACRTIGIEVSKQGVEDAKFNAQLNGVHNASFYQGTAERLVPQLTPELLCSDFVAIVNPGRSGLESAVITALRKSKHLRRIIYVACKPEGNSKKNFIELCKPAGKNKELGRPFIPIHAIPVDMFPQTYHCELVLVFERLTK